MKTIFVSGVAGFIGSHLAETLLKRGHRVVGCDNLIGGYLDNVPSGVEFHQLDLNAPLERLRRIVGDADIVYHTAATAYEGLSAVSPRFVSENVYGATMSLLSAAIQNRVGRFVFCSSMARYGANQQPFHEDLIPMPVDPYGIAKLASENVIGVLCKLHGVEYAIAVPHNVYGPRQKYDDPYRNVVAIFMNRMLQGLPPIIYGDGCQMRCFTYIEDILESFVRLGFLESVKGEVVNIGPDDEFISVNQLAALVGNMTGFNGEPIYVDARPVEVALANCSVDKARQLLGYEKRFSLEDGLGRMLDWMKRRGPRPFTYNLELEIVNAKTPRTWTERLI